MLPGPWHELALVYGSYSDEGCAGPALQVSFAVFSEDSDLAPGANPMRTWTHKNAPARVFPQRSEVPEVWEWVGGFKDLQPSSFQSYHIKLACPPWPGGTASSTTGLPHHTHGNNHHHRRAPATCWSWQRGSFSPQGGCTQSWRTIWARKCHWRSSGPITPHLEQGQPRSCYNSFRTSPNPSATEAQPDLGTSQRKKKIS